MKTQILKVCLVCLLATFSIKTYADSPKNDYSKIIQDYINSHMTANFKTLNKIMGDDATFQIPRGESVIVQTKSSLVADMKAMGEVKQNCSANFEILAKSSSIVIARVDFDYDNAVQQNFITLEKNADKEWKITQVCKIFNDKDVSETPQKAIAKN